MIDAIIIGGGPLGLNAAIKLGKLGYRGVILEGSSSLGGQLTALYPEKEIVDIPNVAPLKAKDYISSLISQLPSFFDVKLNEKVISIDKENCIVTTSTSTYQAKYIIISTGLGSYEPRKMDIEGEDKYKNILYSLKDYSFLKDKKVVIFGGGDSALDWAKHIDLITTDVSLVHRRDEFRGNSDTIKNCKHLKIYLSYVPFSIHGKGNTLESITIQSVKDQSEIVLDADYVLVNYGSLPKNNFFGFANLLNGIKVNEDMQIPGTCIFVIGDVAGYNGKTKRIAYGLKELDIVLKHI